MSQSVKISVILTIQEPAIHLIRCLDSILLQTLPNIEVICLYSDLTQASFNLLKRYTEFDNRLSLIQSEQTTKEQLYIQGIQKATGQFLFFTEAAIFLDPDMLRKMLKKAQSEHSDIVICGHGVFDYRQELVTKKIIPDKKFRHKSPFSPQDAGNDLFQLCKAVAWNKLIRTNTIKKFLTGMDETILPNADILLSCFPLMRAKKISVLGETLVYAEKALSSEPYIQLEVFLNTITSFYNKNKKMILKGKYLTPLAAFFLSRIRHLLDKIPTDQKTEALISIEEKLPTNIFEQLFPNNGIKISVIIPVYNASD
ncbi:MAG: glycosyltransferase family 2 protein, partial [Alphaproteobacteria bacterium]|nr:glycosyltransferase family 2 protein [Alphaproteobacteria bacterium]